MRKAWGITQKLIKPNTRSEFVGRIGPYSSIEWRGGERKGKGWL